MGNLPHLLALHCVDGLGPVRLKRVLDYFKDPKIAWEAPIDEFKEISIPKNVLEILKEKRKTLEPEKYLEDIQKSGIKVLTIFDSDYPESLKQIYDPPIVLFFKGEIGSGNNFGVVGTRKITGYGKAVTEKLTSGLVMAGFTIVSGLARGVDTIAHKTAVTENGRTLAVLGGGIETIFPSENINLAKQILETGGAYLSEYPPSYPHLAGNFPARNRIISGLCKAILVTEAASDSGSLITARLALEQGREVFAVPGPITSTVSEGTADLIKEGAKVVTKVEDILEELGVEKFQITNDKLQMTNLSEVENQILKCLENETKHIDEICRNLNKSASEVSASLIKMEIKGFIKNLGGGNYTN